MGKKTSLTILLLSACSCPLASRGMAQLSAPAHPGTSDATWSLAATGDTVMTHPVSVYEPYPAFKGLVAVIREADAGFTNLEISLFRMADFSGYPQAESSGIWFVGPPEAAQDLKWMGFNLFNRANNHATEYGIDGMIATDRLLDSLSLVHAGSGMTLGEATQTKYLDTSKGRFALIVLATTFPPCQERPMQDRAQLASEPLARSIIQRLSTLSSPFGTKIIFENGLGTWRRE